MKEVWYRNCLLSTASYIIYMTFFKVFLLEAGVADESNAMWVLVGALSIFCGVIWGGISDIFGRNYGAALAYLTLAGSYLIFALFNSLGAFYLSAVLFGLCAWSIPTIMAAAAGDQIGPDLASAGVGFVTLFFGIGQVIGPTLGIPQGCNRNVYRPIYSCYSDLTGRLFGVAAAAQETRFRCQGKIVRI